MNRINELVELIKVHSKIYYEGLGDIISISDEEFDKLIEELSEIDPDNKLLTSPGYGYVISSDKEKMNHDLAPITGINHKTKSKNLMNNFSEDTSKVVITPKLDGTSIILTYRNDRLVKALSRGNGSEGSNILDIISQLSSVPATIDNDSETLIVRGELVNLSSEGNIRNQSNGLIMRKNYSLTDDEKDEFQFIPYSIINIKMDKLTELRTLSDKGFNKVPYLVVNSKMRSSGWDWNSKSEEVIEELSDFNGMILPIDGIIFESNEYSSRSDDSRPYTRKMIAYKLDSTSSESKVIDIRWRLSTLGKYFPVVILDKVELDGAQVRKVSGGSYSDLKRRGLGIGSKVIVCRSGGVIPYITDVLESSEEIPIPKDSYVKGAHLFKDDHSISESRLIRNIFMRMIPDGYGADLFNRISSRFPLEFSNLSDFKKLVLIVNKLPLNRDREFITTTNQIEVIKITFEKIVEYEINTFRILSLCSINGLGTKLNRKLSEKYSNISDLITDIENGISIRKYSNSAVNTSVNENISNIKLMVDFFKDNPSHSPVEVIEEEDNSLEVVVLTNLVGSSKTKSEIKSMMKDKYRFTESVKASDIVVYGKPNSSKYNLAEKLGKTLIQVEDFINQ